MNGKILYNWLKDLYPIYRCLTGEGVRETLSYLNNIVPDLKVKHIKSGTKVFDWEVPLEWKLYDAYILDNNGNKIIDFNSNNLHVWGYSTYINKVIDYNELVDHLRFLQHLPDAIPYVTTYYNKNWGFCLSYNQFKTLKKDIKYKVYINSKHFKGKLSYGELVIKGSSKKEILLSTYICHPSLANNELSGPVVTIALAKYLITKSNYYTYRILFLPETIGPISYLAKNNLNNIKKNHFCGFQITCCGDDHNVSYLTSKYANGYIDKIVRFYLKTNNINYREFDFLNRGSDERQWSSPGVDFEIGSLMRSKYHEYKEYHTSLDNLNFVSEKGLYGGYENILNCIKLIEINHKYKTLVLCEPKLGKRNLYENVSFWNNAAKKNDLLNIIMYLDGKNDLIDLTKILNLDLNYIINYINLLLEHNLIEFKND